MVLRAAFLLVALLAQPRTLTADAQDEEPLFVFENGYTSQYSLENNVFALHDGPGWLRTRRVWNDFVMTAEFRLRDAKTEAAVGVRTLTAVERWPDSGYAVRLSASAPAGDVVAKRAKSVVLQPSSLPAIRPGEWHALLVKAEGTRLTVTIDGAIATTTEIEHLFGSVLLQVTRGSAEFRSIVVRPLRLAVPATDLRDPALDARVERPRLVREIKPSYTASLLQRKIEGTIEFEIIIHDDGTVRAVTATKRGDPQLEQAGMAAVARWRFSPAKVDGKPIPVVAGVELTFRLRS
jgi:TonB family protein